MSTPSANTRSRTPPPPASSPPHVTQQFSLGADVGSAVAICSSLEAESEADSNKVLDLRRELLALLENPQAHKDQETRKKFCLKFLQYSKAGPLNSDDILVTIAKHFFGMKEFKLALVGSGGVGKTAFVSKSAGKRFISKYEPTHGAEVTPVIFLTDQHYLIKFNVWDTAGVDKHGKMRDEYYVGCDGAILMYDVTSTPSYKELALFYKDLTRVCGVPIVCAGNKADAKAKDRKVKPNQTVFQRKKGLRHSLISTKSGNNIEQPFLNLAKLLLRDDQLRFVKNSEADVPHGHIALALTASRLSLEDSSKQADVAEAAAMSLPPSTDDDGGL